MEEDSQKIEKREKKLDLEQLSTEIENESTKIHRGFDENVWEKESFHNEEHFPAVSEAGIKLIDAVISDKENDPLNLQDELDRWCDMNNVDTPITLSEFKFVFRWAAATHDTGNTAKGLAFDGQGKITPKYFEHYTSEGAEERSAEFLGRIVEAKTEDLQNKDRLFDLIKLGKDLILQTKYFKDKLPPGENRPPFEDFVRLCDQVGNRVFYEGDHFKQQIGLLKEMVSEISEANEESSHAPLSSPNNFFVNFAQEKFYEYVEKEEDREKILEIWGEDIKDVNLPNLGIDNSQPILPSEYLILYKKYEERKESPPTSSETLI